jgi:myo-inositol 2-dehydrogenase/D-chiro-inositol 1-dehydrogenase
MARVGFVGTGGFARSHAEALRTLKATIVACYSTNKAKAVAFAEDFGAKVFADPLEMIDREVIDVLYVVVPPFAHDGKVECKAVAHGIPLLCEKPVGLDLGLCKELSREIRRTGLVTSSGYLLRLAGLMGRVREVVARNAVSTVRSCRLANMPEVHWWRRMEQSGGQMVEQVTHFVDLLRYVVGEVRSVASATTSGLAPRKYSECDIYDSMEALLVFEGGAIGSIAASHLLNSGGARIEPLEVCGQDFYLSYDLQKLRYKEGAAEWVELEEEEGRDLLVEENRLFLDAASRGDPSAVAGSYSDAVQTLAVTLAMNESARTGRFVEVERIV